MSGVAGDAYKALENQYGVTMTDFYQKFRFRRGRTPGQAFTGKTLRRMMKPYHLEELKKVIGEQDGKMWTDYLASIIQLHSICVKKELSAENVMEDAFFNFKQCFQESIVFG